MSKLTSELRGLAIEAQDKDDVCNKALSYDKALSKVRAAASRGLFEIDLTITASVANRFEREDFFVFKSSNSTYYIGWNG